MRSAANDAIPESELSKRQIAEPLKQSGVISRTLIQTSMATMAELGMTHMFSIYDYVEPQVQTFTVSYKEQKHSISFDVNFTVAALKVHLNSIVQIPVDSQQIQFNGLVITDDTSLKSCGISSGSQVVVVGSTYEDLFMQSSLRTCEILKEIKKTKPISHLSQQRCHSQVLARGCPTNGTMLNSNGSPVRLGFNVKSGVFMQIETMDRTHKVRHHSSVSYVIHDSIKGHEDYHIMGIQLGWTADSIYWIYWVPTHYVDAITNDIFAPSAKCQTRITETC